MDSTTTVASTLHVLEPLAQEIYAITGNFPADVISSEKIHIINIDIRENARSSMLVRTPRFMLLQFKMSYHLYRIASKFDIIFLAAGAATFFLPALLAKLMRKRIVFLYPGRDPLQKTAEIAYQKTLLGTGKRVFLPIVGVLERLNHRLSDKIVVFRSDVTSPALRRYAAKVSPGGSRFYVDAGSFKIDENLDSRENLVGYIGRFEEIKGVMNFVKAIPLILRRAAAVKFLIGGQGSQRDEIEKEIKEAGLGDKITLTGWIPHDKLPQYLNEIKLLVIPSHTEVGPQILFEAMACGTPVLATSVGVVPDVVEDGETGFILADNSPEGIAESVIKALETPNLNEITKKARMLVEERFTYELAVERYREVLKNL
jgi:glycosyltransferase involved in cell wall biosynthesis